MARRAAGRSASGASAAARGWSATAILADAGCREIVRTLGEGEGARRSAPEIASRARAGVTPRLIRDRIRELHRAGFLVPVDAFPALQWSLTAAGRDLHRLLSVIERIVLRAAGLDGERLSADARDSALQRTLRALSDPAVQHAIGALAGTEPVPPATLEARCAPTSRRTLYRRLQAMVDAGVVLRETSAGVPRTSTYALAPRWRHAAVLWMLPAWWESRRHQPDSRSHVLDVAVPLRVTLPTVSARGLPDGGRVRWTIEYHGDRADVVAEVAGDRLREVTAPDAPVDAEVVGTPAGWASALIADQPDALRTGGDATLARAVSDAVRAELLASMR